MESHKILVWKPLRCLLKGYFFPKYIEIATEENYKTDLK